MSDPLHDMVLAACDLKAGAPKSFEELLTALLQYEVKCVDDLLACDESALVEARSRTKEVRKLRLKLLTCQQLREKAEKR